MPNRRSDNGHSSGSPRPRVSQSRSRCEPISNSVQPNSLRHGTFRNSNPRANPDSANAAASANATLCVHWLWKSGSRRGSTRMPTTASASGSIAATSE